LLELLEKIRAEAARKLKFIERIEESLWKSPTVPKMTIIASPGEYTNVSGDHISREKMDLMGRMMSMQRTHPTYALTGAMCTAAAATIPGTLVFQVMRPGADLKRLRIAHPGGILEAGVDHENSTEGVKIFSAYGFRTARLLMKGTAYY
jgi:2-methylaconitate cis-trans-isomerase PrpF